MNEYFAEKKGYDVNLFGIDDEGLLKNRCQFNYIYGEGARHGSNVVASMLHHFFTSTSPAVGHARNLHLNSDSCAGQNKINILLGLGYHKTSIWSFMTVGHTKFHPDEGFGNIRQYVGRRVHVFCMDDLAVAIKDSSQHNRCVRFSIKDVFDYEAKLSTEF